MRNKWTPFAVILLMVMIAATFIRLPYYVTKPGDAHDLDPIVEVAGGDDDPGTLMLTTIKMGQANIFAYALASFRDYEEILPVNDVRSPHESDEEYNVRQKYLMDNSQQNAVTVAFDAAKKPYELLYKGIYILNVFPDMPAEKILKAGDRIIAIDGKEFESSQQFTEYIKSKQPGEEVAIKFVRDEDEDEQKIKLKQFTETDSKPGIGISLTDDRELISKPKVKLHTETIGGPSAGLMFSLEIYNQLVKEDIANGRKIAGTGTIAPDGTVGRIGGISQKIVAADKAGAEIFLAPDDELSEEIKKKVPGIQSNYQEAVITGKEIGTSMKIVPVKTFNEALTYLMNN
ncbi:PDZ domain-containing protein [Bacillus ectoiniformans]|uniref:SepM family pheromone-processing serine protease n=1 Tax=Bacillus ectoiniformans TaxID=1494429 RepID=UPI00195C1D88|nr:SepM family pheromone-processing serine protease [Bacillus ectoiniformans]MBM7647234.1 PDZ domain-containing protein [Bacillus ectoiniformans]